MLIMAILSCTVIPALAVPTSKEITAYYNDIKIVIDGELIIPRDVEGNIVDPFISDGTTYLPVRAMCEAIGYNVEWEGSTQTVFVSSALTPEHDQGSAKE